MGSMEAAADATQHVPNPERVAAGRRNRQERGELTPEGRGTLRGGAGEQTMGKCQGRARRRVCCATPSKVSGKVPGILAFTSRTSDRRKIR